MIKNQIDKDFNYYLEYKNNQDKTMNDLNNLYLELIGNEKMLYNVPRDFNTIKSGEGNHLAINPAKPLSNEYLININNQCLQVDNRNPNRYTLANCNKNTPSQRFNLHNVYDDISFNIQFKNMPTEEEKTTYPFSLVKSSLNGMCLQDNNDGSISLNKCSSLKGQRWIGLSNVQMCQLPTRK